MATQIDVRANNAEENLDLPVPMDSADTVISSAGAAATLTVAADAARPLILSQVHYGYSSAPAAGSTLVVKDGTTVIMTLPVTAAGPFTLDLRPARSNTAGNTLVIVLSAGGGAILAYINANVRKHK